MSKFLVSIINYFFLLLFRRGVACDFPCFSSPFFVIKKTKNLHKVILASSFIGRDVTLSDGCCFHDKAILFGKISVGRYTSINGPGTRIFGAKYGVNIGSFCSIASNVIIQEHNHNMKTVSTCDVVGHVLGIKNDNIAVSKGEIVIEDDVWIGSNSVILSGVKIGRGAVIGAGSIVTKYVPKYAIVAGNPAKVIKMRFNDEEISKLEKLKWWEWSYDRIKENADFLKDNFIINKCEYPD